MYQYVLGIFSTYSVNLKFQRIDDEQTLVSTMELANVEEIKAGNYFPINDDLVKTMLIRCGNTKRLVIDCPFPINFRFNFRKLASFTLDHLTIKYSSWVTKNRLLPMFINCKEVIMKHAGAVKNEELGALLRKWMKRGQMEHFELEQYGREEYGPIRKVVVGLPDAVEVLKAKIWITAGEKDYEFEAGQCYTIQRTDMTRAVVWRTRRDVVLTTRFETEQAAAERNLI